VKTLLAILERIAAHAPKTGGEAVWIVSTIEKEATRFAESLDDYDHVTVTDIGGWEPIGFWLVVHDHRLDLDYEIASHCDYCDFVGALMNHRQFASLPLQKEVA